MAAASPAANPLLAHARCDVCVEVLYNRAVLPCGHAYCVDCLANLHTQADQGSSIKCPSCRVVHATSAVPQPDLLFRDLLGQAIAKDGDKALQDEWSQAVEAAAKAKDAALVAAGPKKQIKPPADEDDANPPNQRRRTSLLGSSAIQRLARQSGVVRISRDASQMIQAHVEQQMMQLLRTTAQLAQHSGRRIVNASTISAAVRLVDGRAIDAQ
jgi:histone H3/H4